MVFPEGRLYTIQLTTDELDIVLGMMYDSIEDWEDDDTPINSLITKVLLANDLRRQDWAVSRLSVMKDESIESYRKMLVKLHKERNTLTEELSVLLEEVKHMKELYKRVHTQDV